MLIKQGLRDAILSMRTIKLFSWWMTSLETIHDEDQYCCVASVTSNLYPSVTDSATLELYIVHSIQCSVNLFDLHVTHKSHVQCKLYIPQDHMTL